MKKAIDSIFKKYDKDDSGQLDQEEVLMMLTDAHHSKGVLKTTNPSELKSFVENIDVRGDGMIDKEEMFTILSKILRSV